jgi:hypothetical protein
MAAARLSLLSSGFGDETREGMEAELLMALIRERERERERERSQKAQWLFLVYSFIGFFIYQFSYNDLLLSM